MREKDPAIGKDDIVDVAVSYDGTWHKRGYTSNHGVGVVIALETGEVLDREVLSKVCKACQHRKGWDRDGEEFKKWWDGHKDECLGTHVGSSGKMEVTAAVNMWGRSVQKHKLRYKYMLCDGDSSACNNVQGVYGDGCNVHKVDCVGHVGKRMYKALDTFRKGKKGKLSDGKGVGRGKGRLRGTSDTGSIGRLCRLYRNAIRKNSNIRALDNEGSKKEAVEKMRRAILAILYHSVKLSDNDVRHQYCPDDDWCVYKKGGTMKDKDTHLDPVFLPLLLPIFKRLSDPKLLERCLPGCTQNQNESFNALIWKRCPKYLWRGSRVVCTAVDMAVLAFNSGAENGRNRILRLLNLNMGTHAIKSSVKKDNKRIKNADRKSREVSKKRREKLRQAKKAREERDKLRDGAMYSSGTY